MRLLWLVGLLSLVASDDLQRGKPVRLAASRACGPLNAKDQFPWGQEASITVLLRAIESSTGVSIAVYEYSKQNQLGLPAEAPAADRKYICSDAAISDQLCKEEDRNQFLSSISDEDKVQKAFQSRYVRPSDFTSSQNDLPPTSSSRFSIQKTGYYCVIVLTVEGEYQLWEEPILKLSNSSGELDAAQYPKLWYEGTTALLYLLLGLFWAFRTWRYWKEVLAIQNYIAGVIALLTIEMSINYAFHRHFNAHGHVSRALLVLSVLFSSARNSVSFFILLIVSMGYGVVKPSLGNTIRKVAGLTIVHFICGSAYTTMQLIENNPHGFLALLTVFSLSSTMTTFYIWTLTALTSTMQYLHERKQHFKLLMYRRVWRLLCFSATFLCVCFVISMIYFGHARDEDWNYRTWHTRWFVMDGWFHLLYTICLFVIAYLWRPTKENRRYGLEELAVDEADVFDMDFSEAFADGESTDRRTANGAVEIFALEDDEEEASRKGTTGASDEAKPSPPRD